MITKLKNWLGEKRRLRGELRAARMELGVARKAMAARNVAWVRPPSRLDASELRRAFAADVHTPWWQALNQEIDDYLQDLLDQVSLPPGPTVTAEQRTHLAGGIEELRKFHKRLLELNAAAKQSAAKTEEDPAKEQL